MTSPKNYQKNESGNILIYIMGAVFLLGLLVMAVKGSNTPGAGIDQETLMIRVSEVQEYGKELERAVAFVLANGHSEADIRFAHTDASSAYGDITSTPTRQIFSRQGGGATYRTPASGIQTIVTPWFFGGKNQILQIGSTGGGNNSYEIIVFLSNVTKEFCISFNEKIGITNPAGNPPQDGATANLTDPYIGIFTGGGSEIAAGGSELTGKSEACFEGGGTPPSGTYHYYRVLLAR